MDASDARPVDLDAVRVAYDSWAATYIDMFGSADKASAADRAVIRSWSKTVVGPVLDAGCGPGHWSAFLHSHGIQVEGVDASVAFVRHASREHPQISFRAGDLRTLELSAEPLGGVLAWFSLIHTDPTEVPVILQSFKAALRPGGTVLVGFFSGEHLQPFDHRVVTAWAWPMAQMADTAERAGLEILSQNAHRQPNGRIAAEIVARRPH